MELSVDTKNLPEADQFLAVNGLLCFREVRNAAPHNPNSWETETPIENFLKGARHSVVCAMAENGWQRESNPTRNLKIIHHMDQARHHLSEALIALDFTRADKPADPPHEAGKNALTRLMIALALIERRQRAPQVEVDRAKAEHEWLLINDPVYRRAEIEKAIAAEEKRDAVIKQENAERVHRPASVGDVYAALPGDYSKPEGSTDAHEQPKAGHEPAQVPERSA